MIDFSAPTEKLLYPFQVVEAAVRADRQRQTPRCVRIDGARKKMGRHFLLTFPESLELTLLN
jgi:hypothetical protein